MLTKSQATLLKFIDEYIAEKGWCPSYLEMAAGIGLKSKSRIGVVLTALEERGFICRIEGTARAVEVIRRPLNVEK